MPIVKMPDGTQVRFPDEMPREQIRDLIASKFPDVAARAAQGPQAVTGAQMAASENLPIPGTPMAQPKEPVTSSAPWLDPITAFANNAVDAIPVAGPTLTNMRQNLDAATNSLMTGKPYDFDRSWQQQAGFDADIASQHPEASTAGSVAGAVGPLVALGMTPKGGQALGMTGTTAQRAGMGLVSGAVIGGADAAARGQDAVKAALMGGGLGTIFPLAERTISPVVRALMGQNIPRSIQTVARNLERDGINPSQMIGQTDAIGADAMLMDLGPNMTRQAGAIASLPGEGQTALRNALVERNFGTNARIQGDVDATLGPATSPRIFNQGIRDAQKALSPQYEAALANAQPVDVATIASYLDRAGLEASGDIAAALGKVRTALDDRAVQMPKAFGAALDVKAPLISNPRQLLNVRQDLDDLVGAAQGNQKRVLRDVRQMIDDELARAVPGIKDVDRQYEALAKQREGFEQGQQALDSGRSALTPADLTNVAANSPAHVLDSMSQGARAEIDRLIGTTANNVNALKSAVKGDGSWNRDRLVTLFGAKKADDLIGILEREQTYQRSYNTVTQNSETAARTAAQKEAAPRQFGQQSTSIADLLMKIPQGAANMGARSRSESVNKQIADALMSRPTPELVDQLMAARRMNRGRIGSSLVPLITNQ